MKDEIVIWGLPKGETDRLHEQVLSCHAKTPKEIENVRRVVRRVASADGWHSFRVVSLDLSTPPDFKKAIERPRYKLKTPEEAAKYIRKFYGRKLDVLAD